MGIFDAKASDRFNLNESYITEDGFSKTLFEEYFYEDCMRMDADERRAYLESDEVRTMISEGLVGKTTVVRLSKADDLDRRISMASIDIAREKDDPLFARLAQNRVKERELLSQIKKKYQSPALKRAKTTQKTYIKVKGYSNAKVIG